MNHRAVRCVLVAVGAASVANVASGFEFRCRFVERVGNTDVVLAGNVIDVSAGLPRNIRVQFGVFDDASGPAPAGGFVGWTVGVIAVSGPAGNSDERRNPGRLAPFNFAQGVNANGNPPLPTGDPFQMLTEIDNTLGPQSPAWQCDGAGVPLPQPPAVVRGRNTFVSTYAFQIDPSVNWTGYTVTVSGNLIAATEWRTIGTPVSPDCGDPANPADDMPGSVTYGPLLTPAQSFACTLNIPPPVSPGAAALFSIAGIFASRRRRSADGHVGAGTLA